jgi:hypothetical protein
MVSHIVRCSAVTQPSDFENGGTCTRAVLQHRDFHTYCGTLIQMTVELVSLVCLAGMYDGLRQDET